MPNYKGHLMGGFAVFLAALWIISFSLKASLFTYLEWGMCTLLGSLFPDIDIKSKGQKIFYRFLFIALIILIIQKRMQAAILLSLLAFIPLLTKHRGICHNILFIIGLPLAFFIGIYTFMPRYATLLAGDLFFFTLGALSHIWLDKGFMAMFRVR